MNKIPDLDSRLRELAERYFGYLEDQLYDPQPKVDGYDKKWQQQYVTDQLEDLARKAAGLRLDHDAAESNEGPFVLVKLNEDHEGLCPECDTPLFATITFVNDVTTPLWRPDGKHWEYWMDYTYIECFVCPGCSWSASYVEPQENEP